MDASRKRSLGFPIALIVATVAWMSLTRFGPADDLAALGTRPRLAVLAPYAGKVTLVNLFATWCCPCIGEFPVIVKFQAAHPDIAVVGLQIADPNGEPLDTFRARLAITYPLIDANDNLEVDRAFGATDVLPMSYLLDQTGTIVQTFTGRTRLTEFESALATIAR
jgi:thiol-disulfide isomerase/thioredoxin